MANRRAVLFWCIVLLVLFAILLYVGAPYFSDSARSAFDR